MQKPNTVALVLTIEYSLRGDKPEQIHLNLEKQFFEATGQQPSQIQQAETSVPDSYGVVLSYQKQHELNVENLDLMAHLLEKQVRLGIAQGMLTQNLPAATADVWNLTVSVSQ